MRLEGSGAVLDHGLRVGTGFNLKEVSNVRATNIQVSGREGGVWEFPVGVPVMDWTVPINRKIW
jgi:hypothetical protein